MSLLDSTQKGMSVNAARTSSHDVTLREAFWVWVKVALYSFGGPAGQIAVMQYLKSEGFDRSGFIPSLLIDADLNAADIIVSMGCIDASQAPAGTRFLDWSDVPMLSDDFQVSRDKIYAHVVELVENLSSEATR